MSNVDGRRKARLAHDLLEGERLIPFYAWDFALCSCRPTTRYNGVDCIEVATNTARMDAAEVRARCLGCGQVWTVPGRRRADRGAS